MDPDPTMICVNSQCVQFFTHISIHIQVILQGSHVFSHHCVSSLSSANGTCSGYATWFTALDVRQEFLNKLSVTEKI